MHFAAFEGQYEIVKYLSDLLQLENKDANPSLPSNDVFGYGPHEAGSNLSPFFLGLAVGVEYEFLRLYEEKRSRMPSNRLEIINAVKGGDLQKLKVELENSDQTCNCSLDFFNVAKGLNSNF